MTKVRKVVGGRACQSGFSLLELMIVVTVVAILSSIAYPSYQAHIQRARTSEAMSFLTDAATQQQQFFNDVKRFANNNELASLSVSSEIPKYYDIAIAKCNNGQDYNTCARIEAKPKAGSTQDGTSTIAIQTDGTKEPADYWKK